MAEIPDKTYYRIGEVAQITGVKPYVLRFWETEFKAMAPLKSRSGQRRYRRRDIEAILEIKRLLYERRFTIAGARQHLSQQARERSGPSAPGRIGELRADLLDLRRLVASAWPPDRD